MAIKLFQHSPQNRQVFIVLTLLILFLDALFVAINTLNNQRTLELSLQERSNEIRTTFNLTVDLTFRNMQQLAMFIASEPRVQQLFLQGKQMVEAEGGGGGGPSAAEARGELNQLLSPIWQELSYLYDVRQIHFHLPPGSTSFLRLHKPERFGDNMDEVRHIIVDTNRMEIPRSGFETGRVYSGLRGVVPVYATDPDSGNEIHVGALEVGTSFSTTINLLEHELRGRIMILLNKEHVESLMWPGEIERHFPPGRRLDNHYVEAMASETLLPMARRLNLAAAQTEIQTLRLESDGDHFAVTNLPLYDYHSRRDGAGPVGSVLVFSNINEEIQANRNNLVINITYAVIAFLILEVMILLAMNLVTRRLRKVIDSKVAHIEELNEYLEHQAVTDSMTGLHNHRFLLERLGEEMNKAQRSHAPLTLLMLDIDHFKQVNDRYGHRTGDHVLEAVAQLLKQSLRKGDEAGRYGGEEFAIVLPNIGLEGARHLAERLRRDIEGYTFALDPEQPINLTTSIGIAQWKEGEAIGQFIERADKALYRAKDGGRNRVEPSSN